MKTTTLLIAALAALSLPAWAGGPPPADDDDGVALCAACHGKNGAAPIDAATPFLAGQHQYYLYVQLRDFKSGLRASDIMAPIVAEMDKAQMMALAEYFSQQSWPATGYRADAELAAIGETAAGAGQCVQCHLGGYEGGSRVPRLAGQQRGYLEKTMLDFKTKLRLNSPAKSSLLASYTDEQIAGLAALLAGK